MFAMNAMVECHALQLKMPRLDAYGELVAVQLHVLTRLPMLPNSRLEDLLPHRWRPAD